MSDKTEQPTPKKLRDARKKGQVAKSKEIGSTAVIVSSFVYIWVAWGFMLGHLEDLFTLPTLYYNVPFEEALRLLLSGVLQKFIILSLPLIAVVLVAAVLANYFQVGAMFAFESIKPDLNKINPTQGFKKIFSMNNLIELLKSIIKIGVLGYLIYFVIRDSINPLINLPHMGLVGIFAVLPALLKEVVIYSGAAFVIVAAIDYFLQKHQHIKKLKMTKDEVKREYKEMEGDPHIKSKRKQLHKEMAMNDTVQQARKASVIVTNPTRIAVALFYDKDETPLPVVLAKAEDHLARRIIAMAKEEDIPIMENVPLARSLHETGEVNQYIPSELIEPVAEVLRWVQSLEHSR